VEAYALAVVGAVSEAAGLPFHLFDQSVGALGAEVRFRDYYLVHSVDNVVWTVRDILLGQSVAKLEAFSFDMRDCICPT
jgi:hypothetical protein